MELSTFAERLLCGSTLADKLLDPGELTDAEPRTLAAFPEEPARPVELALPERGAHARARFPGEKELERAEERGLVLHFFANHELLALELMALALLKFPDAPPAFRRGLAATIAEEQKHMRLYLERMKELGIPFGAAPVSRYFWDATKDMASPLAFVTQMSLTLEQANLDYSLHYRDLFQRLGDAETARILDVVYKEEIGHVKHGLVWLNRWRDPADSDWTAYVKALPPPLTPSRAKGIGYHPEPRRAAGLSEEFIAELGVFRHSKGRPPVVYWLNPTCEDEIANGRASYEPPRPLREMGADLAPVLGFLAKPSDVVLVEERPGTAFLESLEAAGFAVPQFVETAVAQAELKGRLAARFEPWGKTPVALARFRKLGLTCQEPFVLPPDLGIFAKSWSAGLHRELSPTTAQSHVCNDAAMLHEALTLCLAGGAAVLKAPLGSSGRHMHRVTSSDLSPAHKAWVANVLADQGAVIVEPWLDKIADLSIQIQVAPTATSVLGITRFLTDPRGQYIGHVLGRKYDDLGPASERLLHESKALAQLDAFGARIGAALAAKGYAGPAGIDAFLYRSETTPLALRPLVEINPRLTMGRIALALDRRISRAARALWLHVSLKQAGALGFDSFAGLAAALTRDHPVRHRHGVIESGILPTNDPARARRVLTLVVAGDEALGAVKAWL